MAIIDSIHFGAWHASERFQQLCEAAARIVIISDDNVGPLYAEPLRTQLHECAYQVDVITFAAGEASKTRETKSFIEDQLLELSCGRDTLIIALGGGVVTDLAGFVAATFCRGVPVIYLPTSLLAMVDASVGGKTGVNTSHGKNLIGAFKQPELVCIDVEYLKTLPEPEYRFALAEVIKHALIADADYFKLISDSADAIKACEPRMLQHIIERSVAIKSDIVSRDLYEQSLREILNFGHTIGHAIERASQYAVAHGHAVAHGMLAEAKLSMQHAGLSREDFDGIESILQRFDLLEPLPASVTQDAIDAALPFDKKARAGKARYVRLSAIGVCYVD